MSYALVLKDTNFWNALYCEGKEKPAMETEDKKQKSKASFLSWLDSFNNAKLSRKWRTTKENTNAKMP